MSGNRPQWRMTMLEREVLRDLNRLSGALGKPWVPRQLIFLTIRDRMSGNAARLLLTLVRQGYADKKSDNSAYRKTPKAVPGGNLMGRQINSLPRGAIERIAQLWKGGQRSFSADDLLPRRGEEEPLTKPRRGRRTKRN